MKLKPYKEMLKMAKEKIDESLAPVRAYRAKKQAELEIAKLDEKMATKEAFIHELCTEKEIDFKKILDAQDEYALMERRKKQFLKVIDELFPD
jgi:murein L,D-transpeptidase YafK